MSGIKKKKVNPNVIMNEGPTVIGMMSAVIESGGSLDTAIRDVAKNGPKCSSEMFREVVTDADTRTTSDIKSGLFNELSKLPPSLTPLRRSVHMTAAASESADPPEKKRMLKDASEISLNGLKETGETYSSSLNGPCMMIFGLGIMVPMVLMSILPLLNMGGMFGSSSIGSEPIAFFTIVLIPCVIAGLILSVKEKNPFMRYNEDDQKYVYLAPLLSAAPIAMIIWMMTKDVTLAIMISSVAGGLFTFAVLFPHVNKEKTREKQEQFLKDAVFELGNRLLSGENFEVALVNSIGMRKECKDLSDAVQRELGMCRGDVCSAIRESVGKVSMRIAEIFCDIYRCSKKDTRDAGRLGISIGRQLQDQDTVRKSIQNKLKSMTDMMTGTAAVFAPLVLGMSIAMLGPVSKVMEGVDTGSTPMILSVYLVELCILMAVLTAYLSGRTGLREIAYRIGMTLPISMTVFYLCSNLGL